MSSVSESFFGSKNVKESFKFPHQVVRFGFY
ncbi:UNVERIFIED_ORG: hypothetical protein ABIC54_005779 [Burkholderia sp. 1263]